MSDAIRPPGPQYIATKQIPRVEVPQNTLDAVLTEVRAMRAESADQFLEVNERFRKIEYRLDDVERRQTTNSTRVRGTSENDLKQDSAIATIFTEVDGLKESQAKQTTKLTGLEAMLASNNAQTAATKELLADFVKKNPTIVTGLVSLVTTAIGVATAWLAARGH
jgi:seryl-tRNA synthetase